jgi:transcriptional regulator with XRE-family HTH domain
MLLSVDLRSRLRDEYARRRARNRRYSLRAFSADLGETHSTVLRFLRGDRRVTRPTLERLAAGLRLTEREAERCWRRETEVEILAALVRPESRPDARWLAVRTGLSLDAVAVALDALLRTRRVALVAAGRWEATLETSG